MKETPEDLAQGFIKRCDEHKCHDIAENLAKAMVESEPGEATPTVPDGMIGLAIYCSHFIEACCSTYPHQPGFDVELYFAEALRIQTHKFLTRPNGSLTKRHNGK